MRGSIAARETIDQDWRTAKAKRGRRDFSPPPPLLQPIRLFGIVI